jgi:hypothetical protein
MHASGAEARRCDELHLMQRAGMIRDLIAHPQPRWPLAIKGETIGHYTADWQYRALTITGSDVRSDLVVEDYKGMPPSRDVVLRLKLMRALHGIDVSIYPPRKPRKTRKRRAA